MNDNVEDLCDGEEIMRVTELIGLGETQREIYDKLKIQQGALQGRLNKAYLLHQEELDLLVKYQHELAPESKV